MTLYEIDQALLNCVDPETGEILSEAFDELQMERDTKIENTALWIKNLVAEVTALKAEEKAMQERRKAKENRITYLKSLLESSLNGQKFETARCRLSFRGSEVLQIEEGTRIPEEYLRFKEPEVDKTALKNAIKQGEMIDGVSITKRQNLQIK